MPDADLHELAATVAVGRLLMPPGVSVQARRTWSATSSSCCCGRASDDWGGVSPVTPTT